MTTLSWGDRIPKKWLFVQMWQGTAYAFRQGDLRVIVDCCEKEDGNQWIHVSYSRKSWAPTHGDTILVKETFIGPDRYAYAVFPAKDRYVNIHPYCLHLWARLDGTAVLPHFDGIVEGVGRTI